MSNSDTQQDRKHSAAMRTSESGALVVKKDFVERVRSMSSRERVGYMVSAGINKADGTLTEAYRD